MSIPKHPLANSANKVGKISGHSPLLAATLARLPDPPKQLFYRGNIDLLGDHIRVSVVGSRKVTAYGRRVTNQLASQLAEQGIVVVSGLAFGVDSLAHAAALEAGGLTIAVLPSGLDKIYPASHQRLAEQIIERGGLLLSEYTSGFPPMKHQFIARNRLIAGLCQAAVITEAAERSGSLHTAQFALDEGKTVLAVPGNIDAPTSVGTNNLIKTGAFPVTSVDDILQALGLEPGQRRLPLGSTSEEDTILKLLASGETATDRLQALSQLPPTVFNQTLTMLEITGAIRSLGAGKWTIK